MIEAGTDRPDPKPSVRDVADPSATHSGSSPENGLGRAERLLAQSRLLLEHVTVDAPLPELLAGLVRLIEQESHDGLIGSVLLADADGQHLVQGAAPSLPREYVAAIDGLRIGPAAGSCGTAAHLREPVFVEDVQTSPLWEQWRSAAREAGIRACWSTPLLAGDELLGTFAMYYPRPHLPSAEDLELSAMFARTAKLAIQRDRQERDRQAAVDTATGYARRLSRLVDVSLDLATADTVNELVEVIISKGVAVLGADGGALTVRDDEQDVVHLSVSVDLDARVPVSYAQIPLTSRIPGAYVARTGETVLFPDRATGLAWSDEMIPVYEATGRNAWATLPLAVGGRLLGALVVSWVEERTFDDGDLVLLQGLAAQCAQTLHRIQTQLVQREVAVAAQRMSEAFQRSLLTRPSNPDDLAIAVAYQPAAEQAQVGGDWYDAFTTAQGATTLVIGDVTGHDRDAAARMGQVRNILRGLAYDSASPPAALLNRLDAALLGLQLGVLATAVLVQSLPPAAASGCPRLRWSNAGHLPPLLRLADGTVRILDTEPDLLLGLSAGIARQDTTVELPDGSTFLLYTDGLVERRDEHLDVGIDRLARALAELGDLPLDEFCGALTARLRPTAQDDVALLAVRPQRVASAAPVALFVGDGDDDGDDEDDDDDDAPIHIALQRSLEIVAEPTAVAAARRFVDRACGDAGITGDRRDTAMLLTSELTTNAVVHVAGAAEVSVATTGGRVRVAVRDSSPIVPRPVRADDDATGGRGLAMVALLADAWGTDRTEEGKSVWFELGA